MRAERDAFCDRPRLIEFASARPVSRTDMATMPGIGDAKLSRDGAAFLAAIAAHV
jgi:ATP-dependent DNA helicase RecQ